MALIIFKYFLSGFTVKLFASFDDFVTRIPLIASLTKTRRGKIAFSIGNFLAVILIIIISFVFADLIRNIPYINVISAGLILLLAISVYFEIFKQKRKSKLDKKIKKDAQISQQKYIRLIFIGFIISIFTLLDDTLVFVSLFLKPAWGVKAIIIIGIIIATVAQLILTIYFSEKLTKLKYKKEIASIGLIILSILIFLEIL